MASCPGLAETRAYDLQGRLTSWATGSVDSRTYAYDAAGNITAINGDANGYDALDRLTSGPADDPAAFRHAEPSRAAEQPRWIAAGSYDEPVN